MNRSSRVVTKHKNHIEILQTVLYPFEVSDFNIGESENEERRFSEENETIGSGLKEDVGSEWNSTKSELCSRR
jgi:hypothetical protein